MHDWGDGPGCCLPGATELSPTEQSCIYPFHTYESLEALSMFGTKATPISKIKKCQNTKLRAYEARRKHQTSTEIIATPPHRMNPKIQKFQAAVAIVEAGP